MTSLRTLADARRILDLAASGSRCVCIGGGILGLEIAGALAGRGVRVTVLEGSGHLMPRQLDAKGGEVLARYVAGLGIEIRHCARTAEIVGDQCARAVRLHDGTLLETDLVVVAIGIRPNHYLAQAAGLDVRQGIVVDDFLATSHADVLAAGDVAEHQGIIYGLWGASEAQGTIAGRNAAGMSVKFGGIPRSTTLKVLGVSLFSIGSVEADEGSTEITRVGEGGQYTRFLFRDSRQDDPQAPGAVAGFRPSSSSTPPIKRARGPRGLQAHPGRVWAGLLGARVRRAAPRRPPRRQHGERGTLARRRCA